MTYRNRFAVIFLTSVAAASMISVSASGESHSGQVASSNAEIAVAVPELSRRAEHNEAIRRFDRELAPVKSNVISINSQAFQIPMDIDIPNRHGELKNDGLVTFTPFSSETILLRNTNIQKVGNGIGWWADVVDSDGEVLGTAGFSMSPGNVFSGYLRFGPDRRLIRVLPIAGTPFHMAFVPDSGKFQRFDRALPYRSPEEEQAASKKWRDYLDEKNPNWREDEERRIREAKEQLEESS